MVQATCEAGGASASTLGGMFSSQRAKQKVKEEVKEEEATASSQSTFQPLAESVHMTLDETLPAVAHESVSGTAHTKHKTQRGKRNDKKSLWSRSLDKVRRRVGRDLKLTLPGRLEHERKRQKVARAVEKTKKKKELKPPKQSLRCTADRNAHWNIAQETIEAEEGQPLAAFLPPCYVSLNDPNCLRAIKEMYQFLGDGTEWLTCVVCWKAWYAVDVSLSMSMGPVTGRSEKQEPWFHARSSGILK